jgi:hypothetical protein
MVQLSSLFVTAAFSVTAVSAFPVSESTNFPGSTGTKALYFQTNKSPNSVVAVSVESGGKIGKATFHNTKGVGSAEITLTGPHLPDSLGYKDSVIIFGDVSTLI